uniref:Orphan protein n=1 Tax=Caenorhabditis tropicalis TaxID=1561998 RepID=A0A1I7TNV0_9PELO
MNQKAARQAECVFECLYPGRNSCTKKLNCDIYLPPEEEFFKRFMSCAEQKQFFSKSEQIKTLHNARIRGTQSEILNTLLP